MSGSLPTIQETLSRTQREFLDRVESHLDTPDDSGQGFESEAVYRIDDDAPLPGDAVRFRLVVDESHDDDLTERRHEIEFLDGDEGAPIARISHRMKRIEAWQGRFFFTESRFQVDAPDVPQEQASRRTVEEEVALYLERLEHLGRDGDAV